MKRILLYGLLLLGGAASAQIINFPDANFKSRLLQSNTTNQIGYGSNNLPMVVDANSDGEIDQAEALSVYTLYLDSGGMPTLTSLEGIQYFSNLKSLDCSDNTLSSLDLTALINLKYLNCDESGITTLNLSGMASLESVECSWNPLTVLNTDGLTGLHYFGSSSSQLTELDLSHSPDLKYFHIMNSPLLQSINIHNGGIIEYPFECWIESNPNLQFMCVDEGEEEVMLEYFEANSLTPPYINTDCNYIPGNNYNSISGIIKYDFNNDGCDNNDIPAGNIKVKITDGTTEKIRFTNNLGAYLTYAGPGNFNIAVETEDNLFNFAPSPATVNFPGWDGTAHIQDFCLTSNGLHPDAEIIVAPHIWARPGFDASYILILKNKGNQTLNGAVTFNFDDAVLDFVSAMPAETSTSGGTVLWDYANLLPFETRTMFVVLNVNSPTETPAVNIDDILSFNAQVATVIGDDNPDDNTFDLDQVVVGSFDPNNVLCLEGETEPTEAIGDYLHYVVNFENIGTAAAEFVVVTQQIDEAMFDMDSFQLLNSSHAINATITGNAIEFRFDDINLGPNETGSIVYKIKTLGSLQEGDEVLNKATIVFDFNNPLITNEASTTFETIMGTGKHTIDNSVTIYPNPAKGIVNINAVSDIKSVELYDIQGRLLQVVSVSTNTTALDISSRQQGMYFLKIFTNKGMKIDKLMKE